MMVNVVELIVGGFIGGGVGGWVGLLRGQAVRRPAPLRPCSCEHGLGAHTDEDGCQEQRMVRFHQDQVVKGSFIRDVLVKCELVPCGCKRFDGEIPSDMYGRPRLGDVA